MLKLILGFLVTLMLAGTASAQVYNPETLMQEVKAHPYKDLLPKGYKDVTDFMWLSHCADLTTRNRRAACVGEYASLKGYCADSPDKHCINTNEARDFARNEAARLNQLFDELDELQREAKEEAAREAEQERVDGLYASMSTETRKACRAGPSKTVRTSLSRQVLKQIANDPGSIQIVSVGSASPYAQGIYICTYDWFVRFRGTNSFGAMVIDEIEVVATRNDAGWYVVSQDY